MLAAIVVYAIRHIGLSLEALNGARQQTDKADITTGLTKLTMCDWSRRTPPILSAASPLLRFLRPIFVFASFWNLDVCFLDAVAFSILEIRKCSGSSHFRS
jgi:hypothetical protein